MAAPTIKLRRSATANSVPTTAQLALGEVAINTYDGKLFIKKNVDGTESIVDVGANAETVSLTATNNASGFHYITFVDATTGDENLRTDTSLRYVPSTGELNIPNVTASSATLVSISASGDASITGSLTAGGLSYPTTNGTSGYVLTSDGSGNVTWSSVTASVASTVTLGNSTLDTTCFLTFVKDSGGDRQIFTNSSNLLYNAATNTISANLAGNVTGTASVASTVSLGNSILDTTCFLTFVKDSGGDRQIFTNSSSLLYNAATNKISANLAGTADIATVASTVDLGNNSNDPTCFPVFVRTATGDEQIFTNSANYTYDASTNTLSANTSGNAATATDATNVSLGNNATDSSCFLTFVRSTTGTQQITTNSSNLLYDASTNTISANVTGSLTGTASVASTVTLGNNTGDSTCFLTFVRDSGGDRQIFTNSSNLLYDASTNTITASLSGNATTATSASTVDLGNTSNDTTCFPVFVRNTTGAQEITTNSADYTYDASTNTISANTSGNAATASALETNATGTNLTLSGNLTVNGTTVTLNTTTLDVSDLNITVASGAADSAAANGAGLTVDGAGATFNYSHTGTKWVSNKDIEAEAFIKNGGTSSQFLKADGSVDSSTYLTQEFNDLSDEVTWANVPNANITESSVTQHQAALSITESQISDLQTYLTSYTETDPVVAAINGIVKSNGTTISAAVAGTDYLTPTGDGSGLTGISSDLVNDTTPQLGGTLETNGNLIQFGDSSGTTDDRLQFGDDQDMLMYFDGTRLKITPATTSTTSQLDFEAKDQVYIESQSNGIFLRASGNNVIDMYGGSGGGIYFHHNGNDKLKLEGGNWTTQGNADWTFSGTNYNIVFDASDDAFEFADNAKAKFGTGDDLQIYHDGSSSYIENATGNLLTRVAAGNLFAIQKTGGTENIAIFNADGAVELYHNNVQRILTSTSGVTVTGELTSTSFVKSGGTSSQFLMADGSVSTGGGGISNVVEDTTPQLGGTLDANGNLIQFGDSSSSATTTNRLQLGASQDLQIYHNVTDGNNYISSASGQNLVLLSADTGAVEITSDAPKLIFNDITGGGQTDYSINANTGVFTMVDDTNSDTYFKYTSNAGVELYYDNSKKLETTTAGATVTGTLTATTDVTVKGAVRCENSASTERFEILYNETTDSLDFSYFAS